MQEWTGTEFKYANLPEVDDQLAKDLGLVPYNGHYVTRKDSEFRQWKSEYVEQNGNAKGRPKAGKAKKAETRKLTAAELKARR